MIEWRFKPNSRDDVDVDPVQGEFFTTRDIDNISTALIREGVQNALDERSKSEMKTVRIRVFLSGEKYAVPPDLYAPLIATLRPHLEAAGAGLQSLPDMNFPMKFLVFEDFNTKGLEGDPEEFFVENSKDTGPHNFYYFWRNVGRSGKTDDKLGRWGLGKTVFPASSMINAFWGLTVRRSDERKLLMGQCVLRIHNREDDKRQESGFKPYGMFGNFKSEDCFASPVETAEEVKKYEEIFKLERKSNPGLSLIIPFVHDEISASELAYSVIEQYFFPIFEGKLEVEICAEDEIMLLDKNSVYETLDKIRFDFISSADDKPRKSKESFTRLFDFARWTLQVQDSDFIRLNSPDLKNKPQWRKTLFDGIDQETIRSTFEQKDRIAFRIPLKYQLVNGIAKIGWFDAFLEKDNMLIKPESLFVRDGITISGINSLDKGLVRGLVVIYDTDLARMLGDSENPAHTEWQSDSRNFKGKYEDGKEAIVYVKNSLKKLFDFLQRPMEGLQKDLLVDFFSIPQHSDVDTKYDDASSKERGTKEQNNTNLIILNRKPSQVIVEKIISGFKILKNPIANDMGDVFRFKIGYDIAKGNPIESYHVLDFDISKTPIKIESEGVYFKRKELNELEFEVEDVTHFEIKVTGFDDKRDLFVKQF